MSTARDVDQRQSAAKMALKIKRDHERAGQLALEALALFGDLDATDEQRGDLAHSLAGLFRDLGDLERCEPLAVQAIEREAALAEPRPLILATRHLFHAKLLYDLRRFGEAAHHARTGLAIYETGIAGDHPELARVREHVAAIVAGVPQPS